MQEVLRLRFLVLTVNLLDCCSFFPAFLLSSFQLPRIPTH